MKKRLGIVALECLIDLGITVVYAVFAGILIVAVVASDDGPVSILRAGLYASALPAAVLALIAAEIGLRAIKEWRSGRSARGFSARRLEAARMSPSRS